jgi:hypothetical protein
MTINLFDNLADVEFRRSAPASMKRRNRYAITGMYQ